jgi:hypothetical protein
MVGVDLVPRHFFSSLPTVLRTPGQREIPRSLHPCALRLDRNRELTNRSGTSAAMAMT